MARDRAREMRRTLRNLHPSLRSLAVVDMLKSAQHEKLRHLHELSDTLSEQIERREAGQRPGPLHLELTVDKHGSETHLVASS
jgi:hypothetical protein